MKEFWDSRYNAEEFVYGTEPNEFLKTQIETLKLEPKKVLLPCDGEGRNSVYLAQKNWDVFAFDYSEKGKEKALLLAESKNVKIDYQIKNIEELSTYETKFDCIVLIFAHFPSNIRKEVHSKLASMLNQNGTLILEGFNKKQIENKRSSGGPKDLDLLYTKEMILNDFSALECTFCEEREVTLKEGTFHSGLADIVSFVGRKN